MRVNVNIRSGYKFLRFSVLLFVLFIVLGLHFASPSTSCSCGGGGETGTKSIAWTPNYYKFKFNEYKGFTLKNTGTESVTITNIEMKSGGAFIYYDVGKCLNRTMTPGSSCLVEVYCQEWEKSGTLLATGSGGLPGTIASFDSKP